MTLVPNKIAYDFNISLKIIVCVIITTTMVWCTKAVEADYLLGLKKGHVYFWEH